MIIRKVYIKNFRSVKEGEIDFTEFKCRILVGINESGKTNVLHALGLLSDDFDSKSSDIREPLREEKLIDEAYIDYYFEISDEEIIDLKNELKNKIVGDFPELLNEIEKIYKNIILRVDLLANDRLYKIGDLKIESQINWKKPKTNIPPVININYKNNQHQIADFWLINTNLVDGQDITNYCEDISNLSEYINDKVFKFFQNFIENKFPEVIYWEYSPSNLLPPKIKIENFKINPDICKPLVNIFILGDIPKDKISSKLTEAQNKGSNSFRNFLNGLATKATQHFRKIWKEYKNVKFSLMPNGDFIDCGVEEEGNIYDFDKRSDGFKKFVSLLLMISYPERMGLLKNKLILIDEADTSLHPSGARYLRDELIKLSENNYVVYSTHSIFMIDRKEHGRHYILRKEKGITKIEEASESNIFTEEVLYNALGSSIWEILKEKNILFEGWRDLEIFELALKSKNVSLDIKSFFNSKNIGRAYASGVNDIKNIAPILQLGERKVLIISDSDQPAVGKQKEFQNKRLWGKWMRYDEFIEKIVTLEDFIKNEKIIFILNKIGVKTKDLILSNYNKLQQIKNFLAKPGDQVDNKIKIFKKELFDNLNKNNIEEIYFEFITKLKEELEKL